MKILIVYGTSEGQTRKIARYIEDVLQQEGHQVAIADATDEPPAPEGYDGVIIGSSIHMHSYQKSIKKYVSENITALNEMRSALFTVSMAVATGLDEEEDEVEDLEEDFLEDMGWEPGDTKHIAGALRYTKYDYLTKLVMRLISKSQGRTTDTSQDHEYTDWDEVREFALYFID